MKRFPLTLLLLLCMVFTSRGQNNVGINDNNSNPDASAVLDVFSTNKGMLIPRVSLNSASSGGSNWIIKEKETAALSESIYVVLKASRGWRMISSPSATNYEDLLSGFITQGAPGTTYPDKQPNLLWFDETNTLTSNMSWRTMDNLSNSILPGRGHFFYVVDSASVGSNDSLSLRMNAGGTANYSGGTFSFGGGNQPLTFSSRSGGQISGDSVFFDKNASDEGWNLLGNPTYSTLNWDDPTGWTKKNLNNTIYIWDPGANSGYGEYKVWNGSNGSLGNGLIAPYQAFWVQAYTADPGLSFTSNALTSGGVFYGGNTITKSQQTVPDPSAINLSLNAGRLKSTAIVSFMADAQVGPDNWDAYRLEPLSDSWLELFTLSSPSCTMPLVINNLPKNNTDFLDIPLFVSGQLDGQPLGGTYILQWELPSDWPPDWGISLHDHQKGKAVSMRQSQSYSFEFPGTKSSKWNTDSISVPALPVNVVNPVSNKSKFKSGAELPPFSIIIQKGAFEDDTLYFSPKAKLMQNYPNPFTNITTLCFSLPVAEKVTLEIFDLFGRKREVVADRFFEAGIHTITWNRPDFKPGTYYLRMISKETNEAIKLMIN